MRPDRAIPGDAPCDTNRQQGPREAVLVSPGVGEGHTEQNRPAVRAEGSGQHFLSGLGSCVSSEKACGPAGVKGGWAPP